MPHPPHPARTAPGRSGPRRLPTEFWWLWGGAFVNRACGFLLPFLLLYLTGARGLDLADAALLTACYGAGNLLSQPLGGHLADTAGRRATAVGGLIATAVLVLAMVTVPTAALPAVLVLLGLAGDLFRPATGALIGDIVPGRDRPLAFSLMFWAVNLAFALSGMLAGYLAARSYRLLFCVDAAATALYALGLAYGWRRLPRQRPKPPAGPGGGYRALLTDRLFLAFCLLGMTQSLIYMQAFSTLPLTVRDQNLPQSAYGLLLTVNGLVIVLVQPLLFRRLKAVGGPGRYRLLALSQLLLGLGFGATALCRSTTELALSVTLWTLGEILCASYLLATVADLAPAHLRGRYAGFYGFATALGTAAGPPAGTALYLRAGPAALWGTCLFLATAAALGHLAIGPRCTTRTTTAAA
ncbi:MFS transporter [Streptomyces sp. NPDC021096]|uniref:MFS transporter n=1 Tax=Streptomyces sp. NPDC021096 TaxID=3154792 RepID=UPI0033E1BAB0